LKRLIRLAATLAVLASPSIASAQNWWGGTPHHHIGGDEMATIGFAAAAIVGGLGYLFLRRRGGDA